MWLPYNADSVLLCVSLPDPDAEDARIPVDQLPRCQNTDKDGKACGGLLRPHVVWFNESLDDKVLNKAHEELENCDLCLVVSLSFKFHPFASVII
jgi:NAD-dependent deacetylase sirtuin 5